MVSDLSFTSGSANKSVPVFSDGYRVAQPILRGLKTIPMLTPMIGNSTTAAALGAGLSELNV
jgi:hypothetical protein